jgi:hypothetical protein
MFGLVFIAQGIEAHTLTSSICFGAPAASNWRVMARVIFACSAGLFSAAQGHRAVSENSGQLLSDRDSVLFSVTTATRIITRWDQGDIVVLSAPLARPDMGG